MEPPHPNDEQLDDDGSSGSDTSSPLAEFSSSCAAMGNGAWLVNFLDFVSIEEDDAEDGEQDHQNDGEDHQNNDEDLQGGEDQQNDGDDDLQDGGDEDLQDDDEDLQGGVDEDLQGGGDEGVLMTLGLASSCVVAQLHAAPDAVAEHMAAVRAVAADLSQQGITLVAADAANAPGFLWRATGLQSPTCTVVKVRVATGAAEGPALAVPLAGLAHRLFVHAGLVAVLEWQPGHAQQVRAHVLDADTGQALPPLDGLLFAAGLYECGLCVVAPGWLVAAREGGLWRWRSAADAAPAAVPLPHAPAQLLAQAEAQGADGLVHVAPGPGAGQVRLICAGVGQPPRAWLLHLPPADGAAAEVVAEGGAVVGLPPLAAPTNAVWLTDRHAALCSRGCLLEALVRLGPPCAADPVDAALAGQGLAG